MAKALSAILGALNQSYSFSKTGDEFAKEGDWENAHSYYQQALEQGVDNRDALYGLVEYSRITGDTTKEIQYYRRAVYSSNPASFGFHENNTTKLMTFVLLLCQAGQKQEATAVYQHAADLLNYMDGKPQRSVLLPMFGTAPGQSAYTLQRLQAMAHVGLGLPTLYNNDMKPQEKLAHLQEAVRLAPDFSYAHYFLGSQLQQVNDKKSELATRPAWAVISLRWQQALC